MTRYPDVKQEWNQGSPCPQAQETAHFWPDIFMSSVSCAALPHGLCFQQLKFLLLPFLSVFECLLFLFYLLGLHLRLLQALLLPIFSPDMAPDASSLDHDPFTFVLVTCGKLCTSFLINGQPFGKPGWSGCSPSLWLPSGHWFTWKSFLESR